MFTHTLFLLAGMFLSGGAENYVTPPMVEVYGESIVDREVVVPEPELPAVPPVPEELPVPIPEFLVETPLPVVEEVPLLVREVVPPVVNDRAVAPAVAEAPVAVKTAPVPVPEPAVESPPERPWGLLAVTFFLLVLSLSANVFLAWQFWQQRKVLEEVVKQP